MCKKIIRFAGRAATLLLLVLQALFISPGVYGQSFIRDVDTDRYYFFGDIGTYPVQMRLDVAGIRVEGQYYYHSRSLPLALEGTIGVDGAITLSEIVDGEPTGELELSFTDEKQGMTGRWKTPGGGKSLDVALKTCALSSLKEKNGDYYETSYAVPQFVLPNAALLKYNEKLIADAHDTVNEFISATSEMYEEDSSFFRHPYGYDLQYELQYFSPELLSSLITVYEFTGGAHGNIYFAAENVEFVDREPKPIPLRSLFKQGSDYLEELNDIIIEELRKKEADWVMSGELTSFAESELSVFLIYPSRLEFVFAPYVAGSWAQGPHFVSVRYEEIEDVIDMSGPLGKVMR